MPKISVIVPVYKVEKYLCRCIDSILAQTFTDFDLILVDDGSPDKCGEICEEYAKKDSRIHVIHQKNGGLSAARNTGIDWANANSSSKWITFIDSDDLVTQNYLECLWNEATDSCSSIISCSCLESSGYSSDFGKEEKLEFKRIDINEETIKTIYFEKYVYWIACGKLVKKTILTKYPFTEGRIYEDNPTICRWLVEAGKVSYTKSQLYFYFINPEGISRDAFSLKKLDLSWAFKEQEIFYESIGFKEMQKIVGKDYIIHTINLLKSAYSSPDNKDERVLSLTNEVETYIKEHRNQMTFSPREKKIVSLFLFFKSIKLLKQAMRLYYNAEKLMFWRKK